MSGDVQRAERRWLRWLAVAALVAVSFGTRADDADAARQAGERDARAIGRLLQEGIQAIVAPPGQEPGRQNDQRQEQVAQQARQMERFFQPILHSELELIRRCCEGLEPPARQKLLAIGRAAVETAARGFAERQLAGQLGRDAYDPRQEIRRRLVAAVGELASPQQAASYRAAVEQRDARRAESARVAIVARLDRQLDLTEAQRRAIEADLAKRWEPDWVWELEGRGQMRVNDYPVAPDQAAAAIVPHLDPEQAADWDKWCQAAGSRLVPPRFNWTFDGQGLQQPDGWWGR